MNQVDNIVDAVNQLKKNSDDFIAVDFDNSCIVNDVAEIVFAHMCEQHLLRSGALLGEEEKITPAYHERVFQTYHALLEGGDMRAAYELCAQVSAGYTPEELRTLTSEVLQREGEQITKDTLYGVTIVKGVKVRDSVKEILDAATQHGHTIWIVSAGQEDMVATAAKHFGYTSNVIGMRTTLEDGVYTTTLQEPITMLTGKVEAIKQYIHPSIQPLLSIGDSVNDQAMLEYAALPVVVARSNSLEAIARERNWTILED